MYVQIAICVIILSISAVSARLFIREVKLRKNLELIIQSKQSVMDTQLSRIAYYSSRVKDLEDAIKNNYGIQTRIEKNVVTCEFTKLELSIFQAGIMKLISQCNSFEDVKIYASIIDKINATIPLIEENHASTATR
jgi:hypothetical protein